MLLEATEKQELVVSYLPLSHVAAQILDIWLSITFGGQVFFAQPDALKVKILDDKRTCAPLPACVAGRGRLNTNLGGLTKLSESRDVCLCRDRALLFKGLLV